MLISKSSAPGVSLRTLIIAAGVSSGFFVVTNVALARQNGDKTVTFAQLAAAIPTGNSLAVESLPRPVRDLVGSRVVLTGYMMPLAMEHGGARQFLIMQNQMACCYGQMPNANEYVIAKAAGEPLEAALDTPIAFSGVLKISPSVVEDVVVGFYELEQAKIERE